MKMRKAHTSLEIKPLLRHFHKNDQEELLDAWLKKDIGHFKQMVHKKHADLEHIYDERGRILQLTVLEPGNKEFVQTLLTSGVNVNAIDPETGKAALHHVAEIANAEALLLLLDAGADPNVQDNTGNTPLHYLINHWDSSKSSFEEILQELLSRPNICVNIPNQDGETPIALAAVIDKEEIVAELLGLGSTVDLDTFRSTRDGLTSREVVLKTLPGLEEGLPGQWQPSPDRGILDYKYRLFYFLHTSQEIKFCQVFREAMKLEKGIFAEDLLKCVDRQHYTYLQNAAEKGRTKAARLLLKFEADVNFARPGTERPIILAIRSGVCEILAVLLSAKGIDLSPDEKGNTLLHTLVKSGGRTFGHYETLRKLVRHQGMDVNAKDLQGKTALHFAVTYADEKSIFLLIDSGASLDVHDNFGETPLRHLSSETLRKYLDLKITTNDKLPKASDFAILFDYSFTSTREKNISSGLSTDIFHHISELPELRGLLAHPIYSTIIHFKWMRIRMFFYLDLFFYSLFCSLLTSYVFFAPHVDSDPNCLTINESNTTEPINAFCYSNFHYVYAAEYFLLLSIAFGTSFELYQFVTSPKQYFKSYENWLQIGVLIFSSLTVFLKCPRNFAKVSYCKDISALAVFMTWVQFFFVIGRHPQLIFYVDMFRTASSFLLRFLAVHTSLVLAFVFSFNILFGDLQLSDDQNPFSDVPKALFKTLIMITGEYDVSEIPLESAPVAGYILFVLFLFLVAIVLFNLLIGLAISATRPIEDDAYLYRCIAQVPIISSFESLFYDQSHFCRFLFDKILNCKRERIENVPVYPLLYIYPNQNHRMELHFIINNSSNDDIKEIGHRLTKKIVQEAQYIITNRQDSQNMKCDKFEELRLHIEANKSSIEEDLRSIKTALVEIIEKIEGQDDVELDNLVRTKKAKSDFVLKKLKSFQKRRELKKQKMFDSSMC